MGYIKKVLKCRRKKKGYWRVSEVAKLLGMNYWTIYGHIKKGRLKVIKGINGYYIVPQVYLREYLETYHIVLNKKRCKKQKKKV